MHDIGHSNGEIRNPDVKHEPRDIDLRAIARWGIALAVLTSVVLLGLWWLFNYFEAREKREKKSPFPLAAAEREQQVGPSRPPQPRLEGIEPEQEVIGRKPRNADLQAAADRQSKDDYAWVDRDKGIVRIPVEDAMKLAPQLKGYLPARADKDKGDRKPTGGGQP